MSAFAKVIIKMKVVYFLRRVLVMCTTLIGWHLSVLMNDMLFYVMLCCYVMWVLCCQVLLLNHISNNLKLSTRIHLLTAFVPVTHQLSHISIKLPELFSTVKMSHFVHLKIVNISLCLHFNGHLPGEPGLAAVHWSKGWWKRWWQLELWSRALLQSNRHHQQTNTQVFYRLDALPVAQPTVSKHWR